jgi:hypothetical protein
MQNLLPALRKTIFAFLLFTALKTTAQPQPKGTHQKNVPKVANQVSGKNQPKYVIINNGKNSFGYDILDQNRIIIHQPSVPGLPGNKGFSTKEDAGKVARLVIKKINKNIMPPTITQQDFKSLKIKI